MTPVDGNALAGDLFEVFGREMTGTHGRCRGCGTSMPVADVTAYARGPGKVARCKQCQSILFVIVDIKGTIRVKFEQFEALDTD
jgi:hypothetical protein